MIGQVIERTRKANGLTQVELSELSGVSQSHISQIESGSYYPSLKTLDRLSKALGTPAHELIRRAAEPNSHDTVQAA